MIILDAIMISRDQFLTGIDNDKRQNSESERSRQDYMWKHGCLGSVRDSS